MKHHVGHELGAPLDALLVILASSLQRNAAGELKEHAEELDALLLPFAVFDPDELLSVLLKVALFLEELDDDLKRNIDQFLLMRFCTLRVLALLEQ